jgi:hypothetical protein
VGCSKTHCALICCGQVGIVFILCRRLSRKNSLSFPEATGCPWFSPVLEPPVSYSLDVREYSIVLNFKYDHDRILQILLWLSFKRFIDFIPYLSLKSPTGRHILFGCSGRCSRAQLMRVPLHIEFVPTQYRLTVNSSPLMHSLREQGFTPVFKRQKES